MNVVVLLWLYMEIIVGQAADGYQCGHQRCKRKGIGQIPHTSGANRRMPSSPNPKGTDSSRCTLSTLPDRHAAGSNECAEFVHHSHRQRHPIEEATYRDKCITVAPSTTMQKTSLSIGSMRTRLLTLPLLPLLSPFSSQQFPCAHSAMGRCHIRCPRQAVTAQVNL